MADGEQGVLESEGTDDFRGAAQEGDNPRRGHFGGAAGASGYTTGSAAEKSGRVPDEAAKRRDGGTGESG